MDMKLNSAHVEVKTMNDGEFFLFHLTDGHREVNFGFDRDAIKELIADLILKL